MNFSELQEAMDIVVDRHNETRDMSYFGQGSPEGVEDCKRVLKLVKSLRAINEDRRSSAIPFQPLYRIIKVHIDQVRHNYPNHESKLVYIFLRKLIPGKVSPLNFPVLSSMSLCTVVVKMNDEKLSPSPITAYIDGYYHLVIPIGGNVARIPLIPEDGKTPVSLPPSIIFVGRPEDRKTAQDFVVTKAPIVGRQYQLHSFISVLSRSDPRYGPMKAFRDALTSFDLCFATAITTLAHSDENKPLIPRLANVMGCDGVIDHFIRVLASNSRLVVSASVPDDSIEFAALVNLFASSPFEWIEDVANETTFDELLQILCFDHLRDLPPLSLYVLRAALVLACYHDARGDSAVAMFLELVVRPFVRRQFLEHEYYQAKEAMLRHLPEAAENADLVKRAIVDVLGMDIEMAFSPAAAESDVEQLYTFAVANADPLVRLIIAMNSRPKETNPVLQSMLFSYQISQDLDVDEADDD